MGIRNIQAGTLYTDDHFEIRQVKASMIPDWLHAGVTDLHLAGRASLFYGMVFAAVGIFIHTAFADNYWLLAGSTTGFFLLGPFLATGLYDLSRRLAHEQPVSLRPSLTAWLPNLLNIALFTILLVAVFLIWTRLSMSIFAHYFNGAMPTFIDLLIHVFTLKQPMFLLVYFSMGAVFATFIFCISVVAIPLMLDRHVSAWTATTTSLRACVHNPVAMTLWALCIVVLIGFGLATNFLGLILTMPVVGHASWHVYKALLRPEA